MLNAHTCSIRIQYVDTSCKTNVVLIYCTNGHIQLRVWPWIYLMRFMVNLSSAPSPSRLTPPSNCSFTQLLPLNITHAYSISCVRRSMHLTREDFTSLQSNVKSCHVRYTIPTYTGGFYVIWAYVKSSHVLHVGFFSILRKALRDGFSRS